MVKAADHLFVATAEVALEAFIRLIEAISAEVDVGDRVHHTAAISPFGVEEKKFFLHRLHSFFDSTDSDVFMNGSHFQFGQLCFGSCQGSFKPISSLTLLL